MLSKDLLTDTNTRSAGCLQLCVCVSMSNNCRILGLINPLQNLRRSIKHAYTKKIKDKDAFT